MKVKLKKDKKLSIDFNYCGLPYNKWVALNQGKTVELEVVPKQLEGKIETQSSLKKGVK